MDYSYPFNLPAMLSSVWYPLNRVARRVRALYDGRKARNGGTQPSSAARCTACGLSLHYPLPHSFPSAALRVKQVKYWCSC